MDHRASVSRDLPAKVRGKSRRHRRRRRNPGPPTSEMSRCSLRPSSERVSALPAPERVSALPAPERVSALPGPDRIFAPLTEEELFSPPWSEGVSARPALEKERCSPLSSEGVSARPALEKERSLPPSSEKESSRLPSSDMKISTPDWLMLDCVLRSSRDKYFKGCALASQYTSAKDLITIGIRYAAPPKISCLVFHCLPNPDRPSKSQDDGRWPWLFDARAVAAHRSSILLCFVTQSDHDIQKEFFVYTFSPLVALTRLPCVPDTINDGLRDSTGILCRDNGEFAVAHLTVTPKKGKGKHTGCPMTAELCCMFSQDLASWRCTKFLPIHCPEEKAEDLFWWETDTVVAFGNFICWVDYLRGILMCDVFSPSLEIQYVPLPVNAYKGWGSPMFGGKGALSPYRSLCVTNDGDAIKFVDVARRESWFYGPVDYSASPSAITSWILSRDRLTWVRDGDIKVDEFSDLTKHLNVREHHLLFPLVHSKESQTIYLVLSELCDNTKAFQITVDMVSKKITDVICYSLGGLKSIGDGSDNDTTCCNLSFALPFIPLEFHMYNKYREIMRAQKTKRQVRPHSHGANDAR